MMPNLKAQTLLPRWTKGRDWLGRVLGGRRQQILPEAPRVYLRPRFGHVWLLWRFRSQPVFLPLDSLQAKYFHS